MKKGTSDERIDLVCQFAKANLDQRLSLDRLARIVNLSRWRLSHIFRQQTGLSAMRWLKAERITQARVLLEGTFLTVKEVRALIGANDASNFAKEFRREYGLSPTQFRALRRAPPTLIRGP